MEKRERFYNLDFLRFVGAIIIVIFHIITGIKFYYQAEIPTILKLADKISWGFMWVDFFFILSGFFLFYTTNFKTPTVKFVIKKISRLLPVLLFGLFVFFILSLFDLVYWQKYINVYAMVLLSNVGLTAKNTMGNLHSTWFVSSLFWGYLFYFYLKQLLNEKWFNFVTVLLTLLSYVYCANTTFHPPIVNQNFVCAGMLRAIGGIGFGYFIHMFIKNNNILCKNILSKLMATFIEGYLLVFCVYNTLFHRIKFDNLTIIILAFACLIIMFLLKQGFISLILNNKICAFWGKYAYSIIITHIIFFDLMKINIWDKNIDFLANNLLLNIAIPTIVSILFGILSYHSVEQPVCKYLNKKLETCMVVERERERE